MVDGDSASRPKSGIPSWQRAPISTPVADAAAAEAAAEQPTATETPAATEDPVSGVPEQAVAEKTESSSATPSPATPSAATRAAAQPTTTQQVQPPASPSARPSSTGLENPSANFNAVDVDHFKRSAPAPPPPPPIITYPEFLVQAHTPPPLITPTRLINALYAGGGLAALLYGSSKFVVEPMVGTLQGARHDFYTHSRGKVEELNARLEKLVSRVPSTTGASAVSRGVDAGAGDEDDLESITSDPTELYHRDIGTQTDLAPPSAAVPKKKVTTEDPATASTTRDRETLDALTAHLTALTDGVESNATTARARLDSIQTLRHYLDTLTYASAGINVWNGADGAGATGAGGKKSEDDAIEELKKEIRSVKGVLLSAKRFPSYYGGGGRGQGMPVGMAPS